MSHTHVIDNVEPQLFDSCDESNLLHLSALNPVPPQANFTVPATPKLSSHDATLTSEEKLALGDAEVVGKGKGVTRTLPIPIPVVIPSDLFTMHSASMSSIGGSSHSSSLLVPLTSSYFDPYTFYSDVQQEQDFPIIREDVGSASMEPSPKGKEKESPPVLPPLAFSPTDLCLSSTSPLTSSPSSGISSSTPNMPALTPLTVSDVLIPIPLVVKNYFDEILPRELRLHIFETLVNLHEIDHLRAIRQGRWSVAKASSSRNRWVGRDGGVRELVKFSRVSKSWQALAFDGQLWTGLDLRSFPNVTESLILHFTAIGGQCIRTLDISGNTQISAETLLELSDHLCVSFDIGTCYTQLTVINLQGCAGLTTRSLHHLLLRSRNLQKLCVKGLKAVTNTTCSILSTHNTQLVFLDISRCISMDARGVESMAIAALNRGDHLLLKELRVSGLRSIDDDMMTALGKAAPYLEVLDLSYARQLHNSAVDAFVACGIEEDTGSKTILVPPRDLGRSDSNEFRLRRRITRLRHLSLSNCVLLTDDACSNLTFSVPNLEFLELSGIGSDLKDDGLIRLLNSTPYIRRIDLEDASQITDAVLNALTPSGSGAQSRRAGVAPETGHALEQLNVSFAVNLTNEALLSLVRGCTRLKYLEADNTHITSTVLKEFVRSCNQRGIINAQANVVDCRGVIENTVKELAGLTRPRMGWRAYEARKLMFLDARDGNADELKVGQDECDEKRVVLKSFYSWQTVDNVKAAREKRRKSKRTTGDSGDSDRDVGLGRSLRWWSPGGRRTPRTSGRNSPLSIADLNRDGCRVM
ncbi:hypothetical protein C0992_005986 [Termitomyces sp. T32_za158]|nr:hypothetical protein C0992_005986 [Termitomyces sp. T32_za158]